MHKPMLSASLMCADLLHLQRDLDALTAAGVELLHFDVMDGHFVPNLMLPPDFVRAVRRGSNLPFDIHLMVEQPERVIPMLDLQAGDFVSIHAESTPHAHRALAMIRERGGRAALAINPATPVEAVGEVLDELDMVLVMTVNPGYAGQKLVSGGIDKLRRMRALLDDRGYERILLEVDGNCSFANAPLMRAAGADVFVVGSSSVFDPLLGIAQGVEKFRAACGQ